MKFETEIPRIDPLKGEKEISNDLEGGDYSTMNLMNTTDDQKE